MLVKKEVYRDSPTGRQLMREIYSMRLDAYTKIGWNPFSKENSKLIKDEFDESPYTTHFAISENNKVIGSHRSTKYSNEDKIPVIKDGHTLKIFKTRKIHFIYHPFHYKPHTFYTTQYLVF